MIFESLKLKNFKSHEDSIIKFNKGITVVVGENGAGKSSILEGISFALFKLHTSQKIDNLVRNNAKEMFVELEFSHAGNKYKIMRKKTKGIKSSLFKMEQGKYVLLYKGEADVQDAIQKILNMDSALFSNAIYVRQGDIAELIGKTTTQKKNFIGKLLGINSLEKSWKELGVLIGSYEKDLAELKGKLSAFPDFNDFFKEKKQELKKFKDNNITLEKSLREFNAEMKVLEESEERERKIIMEEQTSQKLLSDYQKDLKFFIKSKNELTELLNKSEESRVRIEEIKKELDSISKYYSYSEVLYDIKKMEEYKTKVEASLILEKEKEVNVLEKCKTIWGELGFSSEFKKEYVEDIRYSNENKVKNILDLKNEIETDISILKHSIKVIRESKNKLLDVDGKCPVCQTKIDEDKKKLMIENYDKKIEGFEQELNNCNEKLNDLDISYKEILNKLTVLDKLEVQIIKWNDIKNGISSMETNLNDVLSKINDKEKSINNVSMEEVEEKIKLYDTLENEMAILQGSLQNEDYFKRQLSTIDISINNTNENIFTLTKKIEELNPNENHYNEIVKKKNSILFEIEKLTKDKYYIEGKVQENIRYIKKMFDEKDSYYKQLYNYDTLFEYIDLLKKIRALYSKDGIQKELRNISKPLIEKYTKDFFDEFNFNYSDLTIDEEYNVDIYGPEGKLSLNMISGGEKIAIALALRLGITKAISNGGIETILLDEPTIHLDSSKVYELINLFNSLSVLPQMIIVTHESELENIADNLIKVKKENGISYI